MGITSGIDLTDQSGQAPDALLQMSSHRSVAITSICAWLFLLSVCCCTISSFCFGQKQTALCSGGIGKFTSKFATGVTVSVGAKKNGLLGIRACEARLIWNKGEMVVVPDAWQIDIDVMGADLGSGVPVVTFQTKKSDTDQFSTYEVYSLQSPPRLLRTITGGDFFRAVDTNLDGRIEIWTGDASGVDSFESLPLADFDFAPTVVMRFKDQRLVDVSSEFRSYFDRQIAEVRARINPQDLSDFRSSDGKLSATSSFSGERLHRLFTTKIEVLEMVWSYLYSGREQDAWRELGDTWPSTDLERIRSAIVAERSHGVGTQVDEVSAPASPHLWKKHAAVYNLIYVFSDSKNESSGGNAPNVDPRSLSGLVTPPAPGSSLVDSRPQSIYLHIPVPTEAQQELLHSGVTLELVIDEAGKVHSAKLASKVGEGQLGDSLVSASADWRFIPAIKDGRAVASRVHQIVAPYQ
jgi:hypothetical protein